jgi:hypothetical protein
MGLLDDAIREHLDLKRRRGGDPVEIERAEQEALGPVRRAPEDPEQLAPPGEAGDERDHEYEAEPEWDERHAAEDEQLAAPAGDHATPPVHEEPFEESERPEAHSSEPGQPGPPAAEHGGQETAEYDVPGELGRHEDDPLEETPEFLQDTPEHDRLWFEQRPPRDFDFDG